MTNEINNRAEQISGNDNSGRASQVLFNDIYDQMCRPGGCVPQPQNENQNAGGRSQEASSNTVNMDGRTGISDGGRSLSGRDLQVQPGDKVNKIEERPRVIVCPGEGPSNGGPTRAQEALQQLNQKWDNLIQGLSKPVRQR